MSKSEGYSNDERRQLEGMPPLTDAAPVAGSAPVPSAAGVAPASDAANAAPVAGTADASPAASAADVVGSTCTVGRAGIPVDLLAVAREAQRNDAALRGGFVKVVAPAKVNLFLDIGGKREDGYHEAVSIMHALSLHDVLYLRCADDPAADGLQVNIECRACEGTAPLNVPVEDNLVCKAVRLLAKLLGRTRDEVLDVVVEKHIPAQAGLGGGSADAAAALVGIARIWELDSNDPRIEQAACELGADVAFFLHGGCACFTGIGETFDHELEPMGKPVVLIKPEGGVSTSEAYRTFDECPQTIPALEREAALSATRAEDVPLSNNLVCAAELLLPTLTEVRSWVFDQNNIEDALMSGSGSAVFAVCRDFSTACSVAAAARMRGWWARTTTFGPARAAVVAGGAR